MDNLSVTRHNQLLKIAQQDMIYLTWEKSFEECQEKFSQFADSQPEELRTILCGYADCGRMAQQRLVNLACENMIFPEEK